MHVAYAKVLGLISSISEQEYLELFHMPKYSGQ